MAVDAHRPPIAFNITGGQINDCRQRLYDSQIIRNQIERQGAKAVIPRKRNAKISHIDLNRGLYRYRHLVVNIFVRLKQFREVVTP